MSRQKATETTPFGVTPNDMLWQNLPWHLRWRGNLAKVIAGNTLNGNNVFLKRQQIPAYTQAPGARARFPEVTYDELMTLSKNHWLLRQIFRAIISEVIGPRWIIVPRFKNKCKKCGKETDSPEVDACDICGGTDFAKPDVKQYMIFDELMKHPNTNDRDFSEFIRSSLWYDLALDDWYWEIIYEYAGMSRKGEWKTKPVGIRVLDATKVLPIMDVYGNLGNDQYFCPVCYESTQAKYRVDDYVTPKPGEDPSTLKCKRCHGPLVQTAFVQKVGVKIVARWGKDEVIHNSSSRIDPQAFGMSKVLTSLKHLYILDFMDEYNLQTYSQGQISSILLIPGADDNAVRTLKEQMQAQLNTKEKTDVQTGKLVNQLQLVTAIVGADTSKGNPLHVPLMPPLKDLQSIPFYSLYVEKVMGVFGVTPIFASVTGLGTRQANYRMEVEVQNRTTNNYMNDLADPFNEKLLPKFGITDWLLEFSKVESRDALREAQIKLVNTQAVKLLSEGGWDVETASDMTSYTVGLKPTLPTQLGSQQPGKKGIPQDSDGAAMRTIATGTTQGVPMQEPSDSEENVKI